MATAKHSSGQVRLVFADMRPDKSMFFNTFWVESAPGCRLIYFALRNVAQVVLDDFVCSMAEMDVASAKNSMDRYVAQLGQPTKNIEEYQLRPAPEKRPVRNVRVMHAANAGDLGELSLYEFSVWQASTRSRENAGESTVQATPAAVLTCSLDVMRALFLEVFV